MKFDDPHDLRNLSHFAEKLEALVGGPSESNAILVDAGWGNGKTDFSIRWQNRLKDAGHVAVRFDAFRWDLSDNPFAALTSQFYKELEAVSNPDLAEDFKNRAAEIFSRLRKRGPEIALTRVLEKIAGPSADDLQEILRGDGVSIASQFSADVEKMASIEEAISSIQDTVKQIYSQSEQPIILIVDELDRCRPSFAAGVLDVIHHFFHLSHLNIFVLTNSGELARGQRGYNDFSKFFSMQVRFPDPQDFERSGEGKTARSVFIKKAVRSMGFSADLGNTYFRLFVDLLDKNSASLRECVRALHHLRMTEKLWSAQSLMQKVCFFLGVALRYSKYEDFQALMVSGSAEEYFRSALRPSGVEKKSMLVRLLTDDGQHAYEVEVHGGFDRMFRRSALEYIDPISAS